MIFSRKVFLFYCCFSTLFAQLVVLTHGNEFGTNANSRQLERLAAEESAAASVDICSTCEEESMKTIMHNCLLRCLSMLLADQSPRHHSSTSKSYSVDRLCSPHKCLKIIDRCANSNCGVQTFKTHEESLHHSSHDADPLDGSSQRDGLGLHRLLKQSGDNSKRRSRRSSYLYRDLIIDDGAQAWLATGAERGQEKWRRMGDNRPGTEDVLSNTLGKRGYNDISDLCMEFNCGEMAPGSIDYLKCVQDNRCA